MAYFARARSISRNSYRGGSNTRGHKRVPWWLTEGLSLLTTHGKPRQQQTGAEVMGLFIGIATRRGSTIVWLRQQFSTMPGIADRINQPVRTVKWCRKGGV